MTISGQTYLEGMNLQTWKTKLNRSLKPLTVSKTINCLEKINPTHFVTQLSH